MKKKSNPINKHFFNILLSVSTAAALNSYIILADQPETIAKNERKVCQIGATNDYNTCRNAGLMVNGPVLDQYGNHLFFSNNLVFSKTSQTPIAANTIINKKELLLAEIKFAVPTNSIKFDAKNQRSFILRDQEHPLYQSTLDIGGEVSAQQTPVVLTKLEVPQYNNIINADGRAIEVDIIAQPANMKLTDNSLTNIRMLVYVPKKGITPIPWLADQHNAKGTPVSAAEKDAAKILINKHTPLTNNQVAFLKNNDRDNNDNESLFVMANLQQDKTEFAKDPRYKNGDTGLVVKGKSLGAELYVSYWLVNENSINPFGNSQNYVSLNSNTSIFSPFTGENIGVINKAFAYRGSEGKIKNALAQNCKATVTGSCINENERYALIKVTGWVRDIDKDKVSPIVMNNMQQVTTDGVPINNSFDDILKLAVITSIMKDNP